MLAEKLQMTEEEAEKWMVEMVRNSAAGSNTADAKIDSSAKQVRQMIMVLGDRRKTLFEALGGTFEKFEMD